MQKMIVLSGSGVETDKWVPDGIRHPLCTFRKNASGTLRPPYSPFRRGGNVFNLRRSYLSFHINNAAFLIDDVAIIVDHEHISALCRSVKGYIYIRGHSGLDGVDFVDIDVTKLKRYIYQIERFALRISLYFSTQPNTPWPICCLSIISAFI